MDWVRGLLLSSSTTTEDATGAGASSAAEDAAEAARRERASRLASDQKATSGQGSPHRNEASVDAPPPPGPQPLRAYNEADKAAIEAGSGLRFVRRAALPVHSIAEAWCLLLTSLPTPPLWLQKVGDRVECFTGDWEMGTVVRQWFRESDWAEGTWTAYQVMLDTNQYIYVPLDQDRVCRAAQISSSEDELAWEPEPEPEKPKMTWEEIRKWDS